MVKFYLHTLTFSGGKHISLILAYIPISGFNLGIATCRKKFDTGRGEPNLPQIPQIRHVCLSSGSEHTSLLYINFPLGRGAEVRPTGERGGKVGVRHCTQR